MPDSGLLAAATEQVTGALGEHAAPDALEARRMQALSFVVHIPVVCFGIAFPAMFLFVHGLYLRTGAPHFKALAKRWSKVGPDAVRHRRRDGHDPLVRVRPAVARLHGHVRRRVRPRLRAGGRVVLRRGDLHRDLRLRLGPAAAAHPLPDGHPDRHLGLRRLVQRDRRQRLDEPPAGLRRGRREGRRIRRRGPRCSTGTSGTSWSTCTWRATSSPASSSPASTPTRTCAAGATPTTAPGSWSR